MAGTLALVTFHIVHDLCRPRGYEATFFYRATPGAMDTRLSKVVRETFNPRYVWLLSTHCWHNARLFANAGLSKALARKYGYVSDQHRQDRWRDQHFPTLRSDQVGLGVSLRLSAGTRLVVWLKVCLGVCIRISFRIAQNSSKCVVEYA